MSILSNTKMEIELSSLSGKAAANGKGHSQALVRRLKPAAAALSRSEQSVKAEVLPPLTDDPATGVPEVKPDSPAVPSDSR